MNYTVNDIVLDMLPRVKRIFVEDDEFFTKALQLPEFEGAIVGSASIYSVKSRTSYVFRGDSSLEVPLTKTAVARGIVERILKCHEYKAYPYNLRKKDWQFSSAPLFCEPWSGEGLYIDLKSAFYQIYSRLPIFPNAIGGKYGFAPPWLKDCLPTDLEQHKLIRNAIVGVWRGNMRCRIIGGTLEHTKCSTPTSNYVAWDLIQAILHSVAAKAIELGAKYVHTDGYIFPETSKHASFTRYLDYHNLVWGYKHRGICTIFSIGSYEIDSYCTKRVNAKLFCNKVDTLPQGEVILENLIHSS